jgi:hypothetical protein
MWHLPQAGLSGGCRSMFSRFAQNAADRIACDKKFFVGWDNECTQCGIVGSDLPFQPNCSLIATFVQLQSRPFKAFANPLTYRRRIFSDPSGEDVPGGGQWARFRFSVTHYRGDNQIRIIKGSTTGMREHVAKFAALMNRTRRFGGAMTSDSSRSCCVF